MNPKFNIYTGLLKAFDGPDGEKRFRTTASSTITDLAKDEITPAAIEKMAEKAKGNLTIFLNHEYRVPEDVLGSVESVNMQTRGVDSEANPIVDLDFDIRVNQSNPRALQTWEAIKAGTKLGTSIGALVRHAEKKKGGGLRIDDLELLEASVVGIPANPRSWVQYAMKSVAAIDTTESGFIIDEESVVKEVEEDIIETTEVEKAACPDCGKGRSSSGCSNSYHKDAPEPETTEVEPDKEATRTQVVVTVDEGTQEAPKSGPESVLMDEDRADIPGETDNEELGDNVTHSTEPEVEKTEGPDKAAAVSTDTDVADLTSIVTKFQEAITRIVDLEKMVKDAEEERDTANENFAAAKEIIDRIADLPIGRKTQFSGPVNDFRKRFAGTYDDEFIKFLEK